MSGEPQGSVPSGSVPPPPVFHSSTSQYGAGSSSSMSQQDQEALLADKVLIYVSPEHSLCALFGKLYVVANSIV